MSSVHGRLEVPSKLRDTLRRSGGLPPGRPPPSSCRDFWICVLGSRILLCQTRFHTTILRSSTSALAQYSPPSACLRPTSSSSARWISVISVNAPLFPASPNGKLPKRWSENDCQDRK